MITCSEAVRQLWDYLEHEVTTGDAALIEEHLSVCRRCCGEVEFAQELRTFLGSAAVSELPGDVELRLNRFLDNLEGTA